MNRLSWRTKLMGLIAVVLIALLLFQLLYVIPYVRAREVEATEDHQQEVCLNIARELDIDLAREEETLTRLGLQPDQEVRIRQFHQTLDKYING